MNAKIKSSPKNKMGLNNSILINQNNSQQRNDIIDSLFRIFISLFYYEKSLLNNEDNFFNQYKDYYLINIDWINKFKEYYENKKLVYTLNNFAIKNPEINYDNLDQNLDGIIDYYKKIFTFEKINFYLKFINIVPTQNKSYILVAKIMDLIY